MNALALRFFCIFLSFIIILNANASQNVFSAYHKNYDIKF